MQTVEIDEAQLRLPELIDELGISSEVVIVRQGQAVARLVPPSPVGFQRVLGRGEGKLIHYLDDDDHLKDIEDSAS